MRLSPPNPQSQWHIQRDNEIAGPFSAIDIGRMVGEGRLWPDDIVWVPEFRDWRKAADVPNLLPSNSPDRSIPAPVSSKSNLISVLNAGSANRQKNWFSRSYFGRHWRGELSLPVSYFVNGFFTNIAYFVVVLFVTKAITPEYRPLSGLMFFVAIWGTGLLFVVWQVVGIWRSANNHPSRGGKAFWAGLAKFMVVIGALQFSVEFSKNGWPQINEAFRIVMGDPTVGKYEIRLLNNGNEIEFSGGIPFGSAVELRKFLDAAPSVRVVHLNSRGGRIAEARKIRELIRSRGLATYTTSQCLSACAVAYLGGAKRYLHRDARIGFHAGSFPGIPADQMHSENLRLVEEAIAFGVDRSFASRAFLTEATSMWFPSKTELAAARFVNAGISSGQFGISGFGSRPTREKVAAALRKVPAYAVISNGEPGAYEKMVSIFYDGVIRGLPEANVIFSMRAITSALVEKYLPRASDDALMNMVHVLIDELETINRVNRNACYGFLFEPNGGGMNVAKYFSAELAERDINATHHILSSGMANRQFSPVNPEQADGLIQKVVIDIGRKYGQGVIQKMAAFGTPKMQKRDACELTLILYREILTLPHQSRLLAMRALLSKQS